MKLRNLALALGIAALNPIGFAIPLIGALGLALLVAHDLRPGLDADLRTVYTTASGLLGYTATDSLIDTFLGPAAVRVRKARQSLEAVSH